MNKGVIVWKTFVKIINIIIKFIVKNSNLDTDI